MSFSKKSINLVGQKQPVDPRLETFNIYYNLIEP